MFIFFKYKYRCYILNPEISTILIKNLTSTIDFYHGLVKDFERLS